MFCSQTGKQNIASKILSKPQDGINVINRGKIVKWGEGGKKFF